MATVEGRYQDMSTPELLQALKDEGQRFAKAEVDSARRDFKESGKKAARGGGLLGAGGVVAVLGCFWLIGAAVYALALALPLWASALIIGAVVTAAGALLAWAGAERMKKLKPEQTMKNLEEDQRWLKGTLQQALAQRRGSASA